ncbi:MAG: NAD(P)-dependent oxidoreductase [Proteobacteria bacterium]|nr:NAD(P)-dependent oxidoreductase [Pseudomonadota bacterium]
MKKFFVTGATGFIGSHCIESLSMRSDIEVHALTIDDISQDSLNVQWHKADLMDTKSMHDLLNDIQPTHLLHFAWYAAPGKYWTSIENLAMVQASLALLKTFAEVGGKRCVMAGSCAEYDWHYGYCSERITPTVPGSLYGTCKSAMQKILESFSLQTGVSSAWGRIFYLYGPREHPSRLVPSVICSLLKDKPAKCSHGEQIRDFLYVKDVADAFIALLESDVRGSVNICSGIPIRLSEIIMNIAEVFDKQDFVQLGAIPVSPDEPGLIVGNNGRLFKEVGWKPKYMMEQGISETITWWKKHLDV